MEEHIRSFHDQRLRKLQATKLTDLLTRKNPYLYRAKYLCTAQDLVSALLDAKLSSSEEEIFGSFLEELAIFVASKTLGASKSSATGIDMEYVSHGKRYLIALKSGAAWGNSSQWAKLEDDFKAASKVVRQSKQVAGVECVLGVCYGKTKATIKQGFIHQLCGQAFWAQISGDKEFYTKIVEPLGHRAREFTEDFAVKKGALINQFSHEFITDFCEPDGSISWARIVRFNSENMEAAQPAVSV